jgi:hypothetical protein
MIMLFQSLSESGFKLLIGERDVFLLGIDDFFLGTLFEFAPTLP